MGIELLIVIDVIVVIGIILLIRALWEVRHPIIDYAELKTCPPSSPDKSLIQHKIYLHNEDVPHPGKCSARIIFFSDLHAEFCKFKAEDFSKLILKEHNAKGIDAVVFGGDIVNKAKNYEIGHKYLQEISTTCMANCIPFFGVTGNHDVELTQAQIDESGFVDIRDTYAAIKNRSGRGLIAFCGVTDTGRKNRVWPKPPHLPSTLSDMPVMANILVAHNPDYVLHIRDFNQTGKEITHVLSGHVHGGQIRTPFGIEFTVLRKDILPKKYKVRSGVFSGFGISLFLSRGIGNVLLPLRLGCRPEITIVEIFE